jgi:NAD(P)H-dependent FMN reductase
MIEPKRILVVQGTSRPGRQSIKASESLLHLGEEFSQVKMKLADPAEIKLPLDGQRKEGQDQTYHQLLSWAEGIIIVVPEYNHSFPGSLKRLLDSEYAAYQDKPVGLVGVSAGHWGGVRAIESLIPVLRTLGLNPVKKDVYLPNIKDLFDEKNHLIKTKYQSRLKGLIKRVADRIN